METAHQSSVQASLNSLSHKPLTKISRFHPIILHPLNSSKKDFNVAGGHPLR